MHQFFGQKVFVVLTILTLCQNKDVIARPNSSEKSWKEVGVKPVPTCEQIQLMRSEINNIFTDVDLHTSALRLGKYFVDLKSNSALLSIKKVVSPKMSNLRYLHA